MCTVLSEGKERRGADGVSYQEGAFRADVMGIDALSQPSVFTQISATVALAFLAAKQGPFLRQRRRGKIPNYPGRQAGRPANRSSLTTMQEECI